MTATLAKAPPDYMPPAARYRYLLTDLLTGNVLSDGRGLTVTDYARRLCAAGDCNATMNLPALRTADDPINSTAPRRTALWVIRNEVIVWGGIIWTRRYASDTRTLQIGASSFESYYARRRIRTSLIYNQTDQNTIIYRLLLDANSKPYGNIGLTLPAPAASGVLRDRNYYWHERATYLARMQELTQVIGGPDFTFIPGWRAGGIPGAELRVASPLGSPLPLLVEYPGDIRNYSWPDDGGSSANFWTAIGDPPAGGHEDDPPLMRDAQMSSEWVAGIPLLEDVSDHQGVTDVNTLSQYAQSNVQAAAGNRVVPEVTLRLQPDGQLPALGDTLQLRIADPFRFPLNPNNNSPTAQANVRVTGWTVNISTGQGETLTVTTGADYT